MGAYQYMATFYAIAEGVGVARWRELEDLMNDRAGEGWGASTLASDGVVVRGLASSAREIPAALQDFWQIARRFLTGQDAVPPRKVY